MVRAGWSGMKLSASKLSHSASSLGTFGDLPAHGDEDVRHLVHQGGDGVHGTDRGQVDGDRHVHPLGDQRAGQLVGGDLGLAHLERRVDLAAGPSDARAGLFPGLRRQGPDLAVGEGDRRAVGGVLDPRLLELGHRGRCAERSQSLRHHGVDALAAERRDLYGVITLVRARTWAPLWLGDSGCALPGSAEHGAPGQSRNHPPTRANGIEAWTPVRLQTTVRPWSWERR